MNITLELIRKEILQILRNKLIIKVIVLAPILQLIVLVYAANFEIKHLNLGIIDHDNTTVSTALKNSFVGSGYFKLKDIPKNYTQSLREFDKEHVDIILEIPTNFEQDLYLGRKPELFVAVNAINSMKAGVASSYINSTLNGFYQSTTFQKAVHSQALKNGIAQSQQKTIVVEYSDWYNPHLDYTSFMLPGILCVIVTIMGVLLSALNIVREKEIGTIEQLNVIPITKTQFIIGKLIPFALVGLIQFSLGLIIAVLLFGLQIEGSILLLYGMIVVYLLVILGIGFFISIISETQTQAMFVSLFFMLVFILMSGLLTPVESMPLWAQKIVLINPTYYMIDALRMIILKGSGFLSIIEDFLVLLGMGLLLNVMIFRVYKKVD